MEAKKLAEHSSGLKAYDFVPKCTKPDSLIHWPQFESFSTVLPLINDFLRQNPDLSVKSCETVHFLVEKDHIKDEKSDFVQLGEDLRPFVKGARLWLGDRRITQSTVPTGYSEQISYVTFVPDLHKNAVNTLEDLTQKVNAYLEKNPLPGKLLAVESLEMRGVKGGDVDVDASCWKPTWSLATLKEGFLSLFRIWYRMGEPQRETIGFADFFPNSVGLSYQRLPEVMTGLDGWVSRLPSNMSILNITTLTTRMEHNGQVPNAYTTFHWDIHFHKKYIRFLRVAYVMSPQPYTAPPSYEGRHITTRLFAPALVSDPTWRKSAKFECQTLTKTRLDDWIRQTGANVVCLESVLYKTRSGGEGQEGFDAMYTFNETHYDPNTKTEQPNAEQYLRCFRVFIEGNIPDPVGFTWPRSIEDYQRELRKDCVIS